MKLENLPTEPGIYVVAGLAGIAFVEVDKDLTMHQLKPRKPWLRDGVLCADGWNHQVDFFGPFQRVPDNPEGK